MLKNTSSPPSLVVSDLAAQRGGRLIFRGLSFSAGPGDAITITGPNGSGKSTLLRILAGLALPETGTVIRTPCEKSAMRFSGHRDGLKSGLTVEENLAFWAAIYAAPENDVKGAIDSFELSTVRNMPVDLLSAGWRRRAGLSRLALGNAPVWILDEPYTTLDTGNVARVDGIFSNHIAKGGIIILATHQEPGFFASQNITMTTYEARAQEVLW
ncbi:MAG: heme ABC exporter ATP-binding protein CcmA [Rhodospirillaceae bacterium]